MRFGQSVVGGWRPSIRGRTPLPRRATPPPDSELHRVMEGALRGWLESEDQYDAVIAEYHQKHDVAQISDPRQREMQTRVAEADANTDDRIRVAIANGQWHRDRAQTAALALLARRMVRRGRPSTKE